MQAEIVAFASAVLLKHLEAHHPEVDSVIFCGNNGKEIMDVMKEPSAKKNLANLLKKY